MADFYDELVKSDWLGRSQTDYTYEKRGNSMGWEKTLTEGEAISNFLLKVPNSSSVSNERKLHLTKQMCNTLIQRMNVNKLPLRIGFSNEFTSFVQGKYICVTVEPLVGNIPFPTFNHALDPILGYAVHEMAHVLYTTQEYDDYLDKVKGKEHKVKNSIMNILEDERIENNVSKIFRGYTGYLGKAKDYCFGVRLPIKQQEEGVDVTDPLVRLMNTILLLIRYPKALKKEDVDMFEPELKKVMEILTPYPEDLVGLTVATDAIYELFRQQANSGQGGDDDEEEEENEAGEDKKGKKKSKKSKNSSGGSPDPDNDDDAEEDNEEEQDEENEGEAPAKPKDGKGKGKQGADGDTEEDNGDGDGGDEMEELTEEDIEKLDKLILAILGNAVQAITGAEMETYSSDELTQLLKLPYNGSKNLKEIANYDNSQMGMMQSCAHVIPGTENLGVAELDVVFFPASKLNSTTNHYDDALRAVAPYAANLRAKIKELNRNHIVTQHGLSEGDFDDSLLVDALVGAKNVYKENHKVMNPGSCIVLLIDESGSMGTSHRWFEAQKIAVLFERALEGVNNVDFYCYGHTTGLMAGKLSTNDSTWINVYYEGRKTSDRKALGKIYKHGANRDGHAILETIGKVRKQVPFDIPITMFMISDGEPSAKVPSGYTGLSYTKKAVNTVEKHANAQVIHIAIDQSIDSSLMFNTYVKYLNYNTLVKDIGGLLKKIMLKQQKAVIS